jgi:hypothetical protein
VLIIGAGGLVSGAERVQPLAADLGRIMAALASRRHQVAFKSLLLQDNLRHGLDAIEGGC